MNDFRGHVSHNETLKRQIFVQKYAKKNHLIQAISWLVIFKMIYDIIISFFLIRRDSYKKNT